MARRPPPPGRLRIVAGEFRGRFIETLPDNRVRPLAERARTAMGNALESRGLLDGAHVLDAFAGSGAAGLELLSRGAAHVTLVERDRQVFRQLQANVQSLLGSAASQRARLLQADVLVDAGGSIPRWAGPPPLAGLPAPPAPDSLIVILDPPWDSMREPTRAGFLHSLDALLRAVAPPPAQPVDPRDDAGSDAEAEPGVAVVIALIHDETVPVPETLAGYPLVEDRAHGRSHTAWYGDF